MKGDIGCYLQSIRVAVARSRCIHIPWRGEGRWQFRHISMFCQLLAREMTRLVHCLWEHLPYPRERLPRERESAGAGRGREASDWLFIPARHIRRVGSKRAALAISMLQPRPLIPLPPPPLSLLPSGALAGDPPPHPHAFAPTCGLQCGRRPSLNMATGV